MTKIEIISEAIKLRKPISFEYNREGKITGVRVGNPHALYLYTKKSDNSETIRLDLVQTSGVTDNPQKPFPKWGPFIIDDIDNVVIDQDAEPFEVDPGYNSNASPRYDRPIEKI